MEQQINLNIRPSKSSDFPYILELNKAAIPAVNLLSRLELESLLAQAEYFRSLLMNGKVVGFLIALAPGATYGSPNYRWFELRYDHFLYIDRIVIDSACRGNGFGQMFYDNLKEFVGQKYPRICCEVNLRPKNENSLRFHRRYGFGQVGTQETEGGQKQVSLMTYEIP